MALQNLATQESYDPPLFEINSAYPKRSYSDKWGKSIDPRLATMFEYFQELYFLKHELFRRVFPGIRDEVSDNFFKKLGVLTSQVRKSNDENDKSREGKTLQRSLSLGSPHNRSIEGGVESTLRLERFKVRTVVLEGVGGDGGSAGGHGGGAESK